VIVEPGAESDLTILCSSCGLCCDGSLFGRADLTPDEVAPARRNRLLVLDGAKGFEQPCAALIPVETGRRQCSIYAERPLSCRTFECRLRDRHRREGGPLEPRIAAVQRVRELVELLEAAGVTPADFDGQDARPDANTSPGGSAASLFEELRRRLEEDFARTKTRVISVGAEGFGPPTSSV
jgi:uncharacterized protein